MLSRDVIALFTEYVIVTLCQQDIGSFVQSRAALDNRLSKTGVI